MAVVDFNKGVEDPKKHWEIVARLKIEFSDPFEVKYYDMNSKMAVWWKEHDMALRITSMTLMDDYEETLQEAIKILKTKGIT